MHPPTRSFGSRWFGLLALLSLLLWQGAAAAAPTPVNPAATAKARQVLQYLSELPKGTALRLLSGQNVGHGAKTVAGYDSWVNKLQVQTGRWVGLLGIDYGSSPSLDPAGIKAANQVARQHWAAGGLVTISVHFGNPFTGGTAWDRSGVDLQKLLVPGSTARTRWMAELDKVAAGLAELRDAGVVVLWRPLHEMNGNWFWWSAKGSSWAPPAEFTQLWKQIYDYFTLGKGLHNLLWVYSANVQTSTSSTQKTTYYYPGSSLVDVVGMDAYLDDLAALDSNQSYSSLLSLGKPFGLTEYGPKTKLDGSFDNATVAKGIKSYAPQAVFWLQWHSWPGNAVAIVDNKNATTLMTDPWVIGRPQILLPSSPAPAPTSKDLAVPAPAKDLGPPLPPADAALPASPDAGVPAPTSDAGVPLPGDVTVLAASDLAALASDHHPAPADLAPVTEEAGPMSPPGGGGAGVEVPLDDLQCNLSGLAPRPGLGLLLLLLLAAVHLRRGGPPPDR